MAESGLSGLRPDTESPASGASRRAQAIAQAGGVAAALAEGLLPRRADLELAEALVLGLLRLGVRRYVGVFGHGSTQLGEAVRVYEEAGLVRMYPVRNEVEASHAAAALRWITGEQAAVVTSIGPGALHALAGSIAPASDGLGVWYLLPDETTEDEGPNMQQIPKHEQGSFLRLCQTMGDAYCLHTPRSLPTALRRGCHRVNNPHRGGPFYLVLPMNTQPAMMQGFNIAELPELMPPALGAAADDGSYAVAAQALLAAERVVVKVGGGARNAGPEVRELLELVDGVLVNTPIAPGVIPYAHERNMLVGGSKGSICGNFAMENADLLVAIGTRAVCQSDCSRTGYPNVRQVVNINTDPQAATHYNQTIALWGEAKATLRRLVQEIERRNGGVRSDSPWLQACREKRAEWERFKEKRFATPTLPDPGWGRETLTQPAAIGAILRWARDRQVKVLLDSGDVQANGFQLCEDDEVGWTFTETGASYMGFAASALLATAMAETPFYALALSGDGSLTMSPQILIDGVAHGATGCIVVLDNRRMGAISGLQMDQFGLEYATSDEVEVDYVGWARAIRGIAAFQVGDTIASLTEALDRAHAHKGLSLIHVPVYSGPEPLGGMGVFGRWNVGPWCEKTQAMRHEIGL